MEELQECGYIKGLNVITEWGGGHILKTGNVSITIKGVEFLSENSAMQRALKFLRETKSALPFI